MSRGEGPFGRHRFGVNAYYLAVETAASLIDGRDPHRLLDEVFDGVREANGSVVRTLALTVGEGPTMLLGPDGVRNVALRALDVVCARAERAGVALLFVLGNGWSDYGGARALVALAGHADPKDNDPRFYVSPGARRIHRRTIEAIVARRSTIDGRALSSHPAILGWEALNEPRARLDHGGRALASFLDRTLADVARLAPEQLRATGEEGLDLGFAGRDADYWRRVNAAHLFRHRQSFTRHALSPHVSCASVHVYPDQWGVPEKAQPQAGERFLRESAAIASPKRLLIGELGARGEARLETLSQWLRVGRELGALSLVWMLASPRSPAHRDEYAIERGDLALLGRAAF